MAVYPWPSEAVEPAQPLEVAAAASHHSRPLMTRRKRVEEEAVDPVERMTDVP